MTKIGGAGFLASSMVKQLLEKGYTVHATLRNLGDESKVGFLKGLPFAQENLVLFQADIYSPDDFKAAIQGCEAVIHLATPLLHNPDSSQYKNTSEAAVAGVKSIAESCISSGTVKRLIYTASIVGASPLKDGTAGNYKESMDETCWTPLTLSIPYFCDLMMDYTSSKTLAEKQVLKYNGEKLEVVTLACGLVGGDSLMKSTFPSSIVPLLSQFLKDKLNYQILRFLEELNGKIPIVHVQDVTSAHIFCMENSAINGRFLCASAFLKSFEIATLLQTCHPEIKIDDEFIEDSKREIKWGSSKLEEAGFEYKYNTQQILSDSLQCFRRISNAK